MNEVWKPVVGFESVYDVSTYGNVKSKHRVLKRSNGRLITINERILKPGVNSGGYKTVVLRNMGANKTVGIHVLVAQTFLNYVNDGTDQVIDHIDEDKLNNYIYNLQIVTFRKNVSKSKRNGTSKYTGVHFSKLENKWIASIWIGTTKTRIGGFLNEKDAAIAYQSKLKRIRI